MAIEIKIGAAAGEYMESVLLIEWMKAEGDPVSAGEPVAVVETAKAATEVVAAASGFLSRILVQPGTEVTVESTLGLIAADSADARTGTENRLGKSDSEEGLPAVQG